MLEVQINNGIAEAGGLKIEARQCCGLGNESYADYERAVLLNDGSGTIDITDEVVEWRADRFGVACACDVAKTGRCALAAAGMKEIYPPHYFETT